MAVSFQCFFSNFFGRSGPVYPVTVVPLTSHHVPELNNSCSCYQSSKIKWHVFETPCIRNNTATTTVGVCTLRVTVYRCLHHTALQYLAVSDVVSHQRLRSTSRHQLAVPRHRLSPRGLRSFLTAGLIVWHSVPVVLRDPACKHRHFQTANKNLPVSSWITPFNPMVFCLVAKSGPLRSSNLVGATTR